MEKLFIIVLAVILFSSCNDRKPNMLKTCFACTKEERKEVSKFVKESIKNANNMSDEEMEDVIKQLEKTGVRINCSEVLVPYHRDRGYFFELVENQKDLNFFPYY